jgi:hypothetical protein
VNNEFGVETPYVALQEAMLVDLAPGKPQPISLLSMKMPSAGLYPE